MYKNIHFSMFFLVEKNTKGTIRRFDKFISPRTSPSVSLVSPSTLW